MSQPDPQHLAAEIEAEREELETIPRDSATYFLRQYRLRAKQWELSQIQTQRKQASNGE